MEKGKTTKKKPKASTTVKTVNPPVPKGLLRSSNDQIVAGVCAGLAEYFDIDPIIVRLVFALLILSGGSGILVYIILWIVMPESGDEGKSGKQVVEKNTKEFEQRVESMVDSIDKPSNYSRVQLWFGVLIVVLGVYLTLSNFGITSYFNIGWYLGKLWPLFIIALGILVLVKRENGSK